MKLYEIAEQYNELMKLAEDGDVPLDAIRDTLDAIQGEFEDKAKNVIAIMKSLDARAAAFKTEIARMKEIGARCESQSESLEDYLRENMVKIGKDKLNLGLFDITLKKASEVVDILDESKIPAKFFNTPVPVKQLDKRALLASLKANEEIEGATLKDGKRALLIK